MNQKRINDVIFLLFAIVSSFSFLLFLIFKQNFIALQCLFFFLSLLFPIVIQFVFKIKLSNFIIYIFYVFLLLHFLLGEIFNFYVLYKHYDTFLHYISSMLLTIFGYAIINNYLDNQLTFISVFFAILFGISCEFIWEILEFSIDHFFNTNMQRFILDEVILKGHEALKDTIKDMVVTILGSLSIIFLVKFNFIKNAKIKR